MLKSRAALAAVALAAFAFGPLAFAAAPASAQEAAWPSKRIRLVVPTTPGGGNDNASRLLADGLSKVLGQQVQVENIPGAGNTIGVVNAAKSPPDGYTFVTAAISNIIFSPLIRTNLPYKQSDLAPVGQLNQSYYVFASKLDFPGKTFAELIQLMKDNPGKYNYASNGVGAETHLGMELFLLKTGLKANHVPYTGGNEAMKALLTGEVEFGMVNSATILGQIQQGKLRALAVSTPKRVPELPDVPTMTEIASAVPPSSGWLGIFTPAGTPQPIIDKFSKAMSDVLKQPEVAEKMKSFGANPVGSSPAEYAAFIKQETATWSEVIKAVGVKIE